MQLTMETFVSSQGNLSGLLALKVGWTASEISPGPQCFLSQTVSF